MKLQRYTQNITHSFGVPIISMKKTDNGEWVKESEAEAAINGLEAEVEKLIQKIGLQEQAEKLSSIKIVLLEEKIERLVNAIGQYVDDKASLISEPDKVKELLRRTLPADFGPCSFAGNLRKYILEFLEDKEDENN